MFRMGFSDVSGNFMGFWERISAMVFGVFKGFIGVSVGFKGFSGGIRSVLWVSWRFSEFCDVSKGFNELRESFMGVLGAF